MQFLSEDSERGKLQRNEFRRKVYFYPFREIHLAGESSSPRMSSKIVQSRVNIILETAVEDGKVTQDFELELLITGGEHSQKVKAPRLLAIVAQKIALVCRLQLLFLG